MTTSKSQPAPKLPSIYDYSDYREYLKDYYNYQKQKLKSFSMRSFASAAGLGSSGYLTMVMNGERNLSIKSIHKFITALKLAKRQATYFENLVLFNQTNKDKERDQYFERLCELKPQSPITELEENELEFLSNKLLVVIHQMVSLPDFTDNPEELAKRIYPRVRPLEVKRALEKLFSLGFLEKAPNGQIIQKDPALKTSPEVDFFKVYSYHKTLLNDAKQSIVSVPAKLRDITAVTLPIDKDKLPELKKKIAEFREELMSWVDQSSPNPNDVYQLCFQLFPATYQPSSSSIDDSEKKTSLDGKKHDKLRTSK